MAKKFKNETPPPPEPVKPLALAGPCHDCDDTNKPHDAACGLPCITGRPELTGQEHGFGGSCPRCGALQAP